jgi:CARDB
VAPRSATAYFLGQVRVGGRLVPTLQPGETSRRSVTVAIPQSLAAGSYHVRACSDAVHRVAEVDERNNCRVSARDVKVADRTPPVFAGLESATTCLPGPAGGPTRSSPYNLKWSPARDAVTPAGELVYDVFQTSVPGTETFSTPTYTTPPGATAFTTPPLSDDQPYYFVVRARDRAGNRDANRVERLGANLCL